MKFRKLTKPKFLEGIGRELLGKLFGRFSEELAGKGVTMPAASLDDDAYFKALAGMALAPDGLPDNLIETLFAIEEMSTPEGQEALEEAVTLAGLDVQWKEGATHCDIAVQVFLAKPELLAAKHNEQRLSRLASFEYYGSKAPVDRSDSFAAPDRATLDLLAADLDSWYAAHNRGEQTAHVEVYAIEGEFWFMVRHGDTFTRTAKVERRRTEILHFRPAKDDVVVYSPERDEIRVHAGTKGEREVYRRAFGRRLHRDHEYFSERKTYTLEPLRADGQAALSTDGIEGIREIVLCEVEVFWGGDYREVNVKKASDVYGAANFRGRAAIPPGGKLVRAVFEITFRDSKKPRRVQIRTPNVLKFGRHCDARLLNRWLTARGFRGNADGGTPKAEGQMAEVARA